MNRRLRVVFAWGLAVLFLGLACGDVAADPAVDATVILTSTGVEGGVIVHLGCRDGKLTAKLRASDRFLVQGLDPDPANVAKARGHIQSIGHYGNVSVDQLRGEELPYADNVVNLVVVDEPCGVSAEEIQRVLCPNGAAYTRDGKKWTVTTKPWPEQLGEWTHWLYDASGNAVTPDRVAGPPEQLQWAEGPLWSRHHNTTPSLNAAVSAGGRFFTILDEAPPGYDNSVPDRYSLIARDAFNGVLLWKKPIDYWGWKAWVQTQYSHFLLGRHMHPIHIQRRLVAVDDRVYVTLGFNAPVSELDAATGKVLRTFDGTENTSEILHFDGRLILAVNKQPQKAGFLEEDPPVKKEVKVVDLKTGKIAWAKGDFVGISARGTPVQRVTQLSLAVGPECVAIVEERELVGLDPKTGKEIWRVPRPERPEEKVADMYRNDHTNLSTLVYHDGRVLFGQPRVQSKKPPWNTTQHSDLLVLDAASGKTLWTKEIGNWEYGTPIGIYVTGGSVWVHAKPTEPYALLALDPKTGEEKRRFNTSDMFNSGHHHRCTRNKATERYLVTSRRGVELIDFATGDIQVNQWIRGECGYGMMPCNGLIYTTPHPCRCFTDDKLSGIYALAPSRKVPEAKPADDPSRLQKGPAFGKKIDAGKAGPEDWPTYRSTARRSGSVASKIPAELKEVWKADLGSRASAPVIADGKVFVAVVDEHRVCALDAKSGKPLWSFTAGGPVDTPPTIHEGLALFGSRDGAVYCLRASDGKLVWRLQAAPIDRRVVTFGQIESVSPVHGSVLVVDGVVDVAAGRSSHLDGGIRLLAVDPKTGKVLREETQATPLDDSQKSISRGSLADILTFDGQAIRMRNTRFARENTPGEKSNSKPLHLLATGGLLDDSWFNRIYWSLGGKSLGQMLVFDDESAYGIRMYSQPGSVNAHFTPGKDGYRLFAYQHRKPPQPPVQKKPGEKKKRGKTPVRDKWTTMAPIRANALALAGDTFVAAGTPDVVDEDEPWAAFDGRRGGVLWTLSADDGSKITEVTLDAPPVYDGLAVAGGRVFVSTTDGKVVCLGK